MLTQHQSPDTSALPTVLLRHDEPGEARQPHYDWMLADPTLLPKSERITPSPDDRFLWTARVKMPSIQWRDHPTFEIEPIEHHRWHYLGFEGTLTGGRGAVTRVDEGTVAITRWAPDQIQLRLAFRHASGVLLLAPIGTHRPGVWRASWL